jgi:hypothetical protein
VAGQSFDELRGLGRVTQRLPEFLDSVVQAVVELDESVRGPQAGAQVLPCDDFSGTFNQGTEYFEGFGRERNFLTVFA